MYSRARGAYAGLNLSGAVIKTDFDSTVIYRKQIPTRVLLSGEATIERQCGAISKFS